MAKDAPDCQPESLETPIMPVPDAKPYHAPQAPSDWAARFLPAVRPGGTVLDLACGTGRHVRLARGLGLAVVAVDRDPTGLAAFADDAGVETVIADIEAGPWPLGDRRFDGVLVTNYLWRPLFPAIVGAVAADGILIYETFARGQERHGRPQRTDFHLQPNELLAPTLAAGLVVIAYEQGELAGRFCSGGGAKIVQRIAAVGPDHPAALATPVALVPNRD